MNLNEHIQTEREQDRSKSFKMSVEEEHIRLKYDNDDLPHDSDTGEAQSDVDEDEEANKLGQEHLTMRTAPVKQEFDIESLASSTGSTVSPLSVQQPIALGINTYEKKQTFLAAQLAEPNEGGPHFSNQLHGYQQLQMDHEAIDKLQNQCQRATTSRVNKPSSHTTSHRTQAHKSSNQRQQEQHDFGNSQNNNIDYDELVKHVDLFGVKIVALTINSKERLCLAQISNTLLKNFSYNEIHNRRVALGITCVQCTPIQLEMLRRAGAMPSSSRRCGMITMREAERLCRSFLAEEQPPELPENFYFTVGHRVNYGCKGRFIPSRYISSRAKCIECFHCGELYSPNKFIFHSHKQPDATDCNPPDSPNINSWRKHINLDWTQEHSQEIKYAWEDVKSLFNGGTRRRTSATSLGSIPGGGNVCLSSAAAAATASVASPTLEQADSSSPSPAQDSKSTQKLSVGDDAQQQAPMIDVGIAHPSARSQLAPMSQSERRKLPMSSWPRICATQADPQRRSPAPVKRLLAGHNQYLSGHQQQPKKIAPLPPPPPPSQWTHPINNQRSPASYSSEQHNAALYAQATAQRSPMSCSIGAGAAPSPQKHARNANKQQQPTRPLSSQTSASILSNAITGNHHHHHHQYQGSYGAQQHETTAPSSFIYGQLYSQLMQSQLNQPQTAATNLAASQQHQGRQIPSTIDAQLALRHHIWSSLLANIRCNPNAFESTMNLQAELPATAAQAQNSGCLAATAAAAAAAVTANIQTNNQAGMTHDLSNQSPPSNVSTLNPLYGLLPPMRLYAGGGGSSPADQMGLASGLTALFNSGTSDSCK